MDCVVGNGLILAVLVRFCSILHKICKTWIIEGFSNENLACEELPIAPDGTRNVLMWFLHWATSPSSCSAQFCQENVINVIRNDLRSTIYSGTLTFHIVLYGLSRKPKDDGKAKRMMSPGSDLSEFSKDLHTYWCLRLRWSRSGAGIFDQKSLAMMITIWSIKD